VTAVGQRFGLGGNICAWRDNISLGASGGLPGATLESELRAHRN
jgi:hypothetical protein